MQINQQKNKLQNILNEKEDLQIQYMSLKENVNSLQNNKDDLNQKMINMKAQTDRQIKDLKQQIKNLNYTKIQIEKENKSKEEKIIVLDRKFKEMSINYQKKMSELNDNYSTEKNNDLLDFNEKLKYKEDEINRLKIKIKSLEENVQSLNDIIELNDIQKKERFEMNAKMTELLEQISSKDRQIFDLKNEISDLNDKIESQEKTQNKLNGIKEKELKNNIKELQQIINEKDHELNELRIKCENLEYNSKKYQPKIHYIEDSEEETDKSKNEILLKKIEDIQKAYKEREEKLLKEKNEEIKQLKMKNNELERVSYLDSNNNTIEIKKYKNEIKKLKSINTNLEEDLKYYKQLRNKNNVNENKISVFETENERLERLLEEKNDEIESINKKYKKLEEENKNLEKQLINSKGKLGEVLNELAEAETKCVHLEEEKRVKKSNISIRGLW